MKTFEDYLKQQLNKPQPEWFDQDGNSPRATVMRGKLGTLKYETKRLVPSLKSDLCDFWDGIDTPIGYFLQRAMKIYKKEYMLKRQEKTDTL